MHIECNLMRTLQRNVRRVWIHFSDGQNFVHVHNTDAILLMDSKARNTFFGCHILGECERLDLRPLIRILCMNLKVAARKFR